MIGCLENFLAALEVEVFIENLGFWTKVDGFRNGSRRFFFEVFYISYDIFCSMRRVTVMFLPLERATLVQPSTYLQHHDRMPRKFSPERLRSGDIYLKNIRTE